MQHSDKAKLRMKSEEITGTKWCATCSTYRVPHAGDSMVRKKSGRAIYLQFRCAGCNARRAVHLAGRT